MTVSDSLQVAQWLDHDCKMVSFPELSYT